MLLNFKEGVRELERQARQCKLDDVARRLELQQAEKLAAIELRRDKLQAEKFEREKIREQERQCLLDTTTSSSCREDNVVKHSEESGSNITTN
jgi:hypothetical protein